MPRSPERRTVAAQFYAHVKNQGNGHPLTVSGSPGASRAAVPVYYFVGAQLPSYSRAVLQVGHLWPAARPAGRPAESSLSFRPKQRNNMKGYRILLLDVRNKSKTQGLSYVSKAMLSKTCDNHGVSLVFLTSMSNTRECFYVFTFFGLVLKEAEGDNHVFATTIIFV